MLNTGHGSTEFQRHRLPVLFTVEHSGRIAFSEVSSGNENMKNNKLTMEDLTGCSDTQAFFIIEYVKDRNAQRAAAAVNISAQTAYDYLKDEVVVNALARIKIFQLKNSVIDAEWLKLELVDNHMIAKQQGKISASNQSLNLIGKHAAVDAFAAEKVEIQGAEAVIERLSRSRTRLAARGGEPEKTEVSFL